jgi:hypothetical protein
LIRVRVRFCACFQDALRALPVAAAASSWGFCSCIGRDSVDGSVVVVCGRSINPLHSDCWFEFLCFSPFFWSPMRLIFAVFFFGGRFDQGCVGCFRLWGGGSDQPEWWVKSLDSIFCLFSFGLRQPSLCEEKILELLCVEAAGSSARGTEE